MSVIVAVQEVWSQCSGNYDAVKSLRTAVFTGDALISDLSRWIQVGHEYLGCGSAILTLAEDAEHAAKAGKS